ncbi:MAG: OmpA family protein [Cyclobacteriaceae bacterium]|nr:OmpA family protein [Cyclobacteriaceae bacterium]
MKYILTLLCWLVASVVFSQEISPRYELVKMNDKINTLYHQVSPVISIDGTKLYYFVSNHPQNTYGKENSQDIWVSTLDDKGVWSEGKRMGPPLNDNRYNQVFNVMPDGSLLIRGGRAKNSKGFSLVSPDGRVNQLGIPSFSDMDKGIFNGASISSDGQHLILYFSEKQGDKFSDLYLSNQQNGQWTVPVKLKISSAADDYSPFISPDQKTLYFSSDRYSKDKVGGTDIYKSTRLDDSWTNWSEPVNLGRLINTPVGDAYFSIDANGNIFTARSGARIDGGNFDLFILKPRNFKILLTGTTYDQKTKVPVQAAIELKMKEHDPIHLRTTPAGNFETYVPEIESYSVTAASSGYLPFNQTYKVPQIKHDTTLHVDIYLNTIARPLVLKGDLINKKTDQKIAGSKVNIEYKADRTVRYPLSAPEGSYEQTISSLGWYIFSASADGYLNASDSVEVVSEEITPVVKNVYLTPIEVGLTVRLKNIYFDFDKTTLKSESFVELDKVVDFLKRNSSVSIEISGHTDSKGSDSYNENLSQGRSQAVVDYLISQGIDSSRLEAHGYGESKPIDSNDTEVGRANNRRVEFTVLKI